MRRTNSKEAMEAIKNAIIESYNNCEEYYTDEQAEKTACYLLYRELTKHAAKAN